ncbi:hypothetical protein EJB05_29443 [Eragrostis curvula]|uniref:Uncharacterized protein n=1 Tax=Eragrostis curvula TaxID=38414 RepID=A0A5J9USS2_9POAL|nr:hypothetical protein EJB05_29443 [Eragrostis curvula]
MWLDAVYSGVVILQHILFIGEIPKSNGRIMAEYGGMALLLSCVYGYVMLKSSNYPDFDRDKGQKQNIWALIFLAGFGFAALMQMQFQYRVPAGYSVISKWLAATGIVCQGLQPVLSIIHRALPGGSFDDDAPSTANIKITAAVLRMITLSYDYWMCSSKGYHDTPNRAPFAAMVCFSLIVNCVMVVTRYIGPRKLKDSIDAIMKAEDEEIRRRAESREMEDHLETLNLRGVKNMTAP